MKQIAWAATGVTPRRLLIQLFEAMPLLALLILFNVTELRGIDYGYHWDEQDWQIEPVRRMVESGVLLPGSYIYPSLCKWLTLLPAVSPGLRAWLDSAGNPASSQAAMLSAMADSHGFLLSVRTLFVVVSSLSLVWVYGAALALRHRWWEALVAASSLGLSWEFAYHARFVATDCILVQFAALTVFMLALFRRSDRPVWLYAAALAAGLGTGTKYTGVFLLVPVLLSGALSLPLRSVFAQIRRAVLVCVLAFGVYLLTTPATLLDPVRFVTETRFISKYYMHTHGGYTASGAIPHLQIVFNYFAFAYFSPYPWLAPVPFAAMLCGAALWLKRDLRFAACVVGFPFAFLVFFCIRYRVVMVRNYLFVVPFLALLLARFFADLVHWLPRTWLRVGVAGALVAALLSHGGWLVTAGESIRNVDPVAEVGEALSYISKRPREAFRVSADVRASAAAGRLNLPSNVVSRSAVEHVVFFGRAEGPGPWNWKVNDPWLTEAVFGPREINFNWYSSWSGNDRIVVMTLAKARACGIALAK